jgi:sarcosine oxidase subunit gamma
VDALRRLLPIDLHPSVFPDGSAASTLAAHIPLIVWRLDQATFELAVFRSYAASFMQALSEAALPFGLGREPPGLS